MLLKDAIVIFSFPAIIIIGTFITLLLSYKKVKEGSAMIINGARGTKVSFSSSLVIPILEQYEEVDITNKLIEVNLAENKGIVTKNNIIADINATFQIRINPEVGDVRFAVQSFGAPFTFDQEAINRVFAPKFEDALRVVTSKFNFEELRNNLEMLKVEALNIVGKDLNGYMLDDLSINYLAATARRLDI